MFLFSLSRIRSTLTYVANSKLAQYYKQFSGRKRYLLPEMITGYFSCFTFRALNQRL